MRYIITTIFVLLLSLFQLIFAQEANNYKEEISNYVEYLKNKTQTPIDYILSKYEKHDVIVFGERDHRDISQYYFLKELIYTPEFYKNIGVIYTEVGSSNYNDTLNKVLQNYSLDETDLNTKLIEIYREISYQAIWDKYNFFYLWRTIYDFNKAHPTLPLRIEMTSHPFNWNEIRDTSDCKQETDLVENNYDQVMAAYFLGSFKDLQKKPRNKAFVIMNYPHYLQKWVSPKGTVYEDKFGAIITKSLLNKTCFILVNTHRSNLQPVCNGKWDAAFKYLDYPKIGFDFKDTPFGKDIYDIWPLNVTGLLSFEELFDGFIYLNSIDEQDNIIGIPNFIDSEFGDEFIRRMNLRRYCYTGKIIKTKYRWEKAYCNKKRKIDRKKDYESRYGEKSSSNFDKIVDQWLIFDNRYSYTPKLRDKKINFITDVACSSTRTNPKGFGTRPILRTRDNIQQPVWHLKRKTQRTKLCLKNQKS